MSEIRVPVLGRFVLSDPDPKAPKVEYQRLSEVLTQPRRTDRFFCQYSNPEHPYRLSLESAIPPRMVLAVFDIDDKGKVEGVRRPEWMIHERAKISALVRATNAFVYETKGGYRIVTELPEPFLITMTAHEAEWTARYKSWCNYLERVYGIVCDRDPAGNWACADWPRIFRIPHSTRERGGEPEALPTYGPAHDPGIWNPELAPEDVVPVSDRVQSANVSDRVHSEMCPLGVKVDHAIAAAEDLPAAVSHQGGHNALLVAASTIYRGFDLPRELAFRILEDHYNPRCDPPWKPKEIDHKLDAVERSSEGWGAEIDAIMLSDAAEEVCQRRRAREPSDPEEEDEPVRDQGGSLPNVGNTRTETPHTATEWQGNVASAITSLRAVGDPVPTGFPILDACADGGQLPGEPFIIGGAPGAGKTTLALTIAIRWAAEGRRVAVGAFDEPKARLAVRVAQGRGLARAALRKGELEEVDAATLNAIPIRIFNGRRERVTIEHIAETLGKHGPGVLVVDSLQTCRIELDERRLTERQQIVERCRAITKVCETYKHLVIVTSEINRDYYRNFEQALDLNPLAAFSGASSIDYLMTFGVVLLVPPSAEHVLARVAKNRLGQGYPDFGLRIDYKTATAHECPLPKEDPEEFGTLDDAPRIDLKRVIWGLVREQRCRGKGACGAILREQGTRAGAQEISDAWAVLEGDGRIVKGEDGLYLQGPWKDV